MHPLTVLVCGNIPAGGAAREILLHLGQSLDGLIDKACMTRSANEKVDLTLLGPYLGRAALEVGLTAITAHFDPYRVLANRNARQITTSKLAIRLHIIGPTMFRDQRTNPKVRMPVLGSAT